MIRLMMMKKKTTNNKGFTLVEVLLSMTILALISIPLMKYFADSLRYSSITEQRQKATLLAQETIETLKSKDTLIERIKNEEESGVTKYGVPFMEDYTIISDASLFDEATGKGELTFKKQVTKDGLNYDVVVDLSTNVDANSVARPIVYGIDDTENAMAIEQSEEMEALWYLLQLNNTYVAGMGGFSSAIPSTYEEESEETETPSADDDDEDETDPDAVKMLENINEVRDILQREIFIDISKDVDDTEFYTVRVWYEYFCSKKITSKDAYDDRYVTSDLLNDRMEHISSIYLLYNIVDPDTDKIYVNWNLDMPTNQGQVPDLTLVLQNLDALAGATYIADPAAPTPAPGELAPKMFARDKYTLTVKLDSKLSSFMPIIRTNLRISEPMTESEEEEEATPALYGKLTAEDLGAIKNENSVGDKTDWDKVAGLTSKETPIRIIAMDIAVYEGTSGEVTDYSTKEPIVRMKTSKGE